MKDIAMIPFKNLVKSFCKELEESSIKYIESDEFKKSEYDLYTPHDLLDAMMNEEYEHKRLVILCLLHYKIERKLFNPASLLPV
jgi:hypothetical protein